jgi:hypothetical protein
LRQAEPDLEKDGATVLRGAVALSIVKAITSEQSVDGAGVRQFSLSPVIVAVISVNGPMMRIAKSYLGPMARPVRSIIFDKTPDTNWALGWHQDRTVALKAREDVPGFVSWNIKSGVPHAEPPADLLSRMLNLRLTFFPGC